MHSFVAKGLFISKRARPDIVLVIAVLATRVNKPTKSDQEKLIRLIKYEKNFSDVRYLSDIYY